MTLWNWRIFGPFRSKPVAKFFLEPYKKRSGKWTFRIRAANGKIVERERRMSISARAIPSIVVRYVPPACVVPMPDGANPDGPLRASAHFVLDVKKEAEFRDMFRVRSKSTAGPSASRLEL